MHQQAGDRSCTNEAIGGAHYGPVLVYLSKVSDSSTADGSAPFFKIYEDTWRAASSSSTGSDDYWGTKDLNTNCGKLDVPIPKDLAPGDYLLRAEAIALHTASQVGGAQFYMTCYQITVTGGGSSAPTGVAFPGAYKATDPGKLSWTVSVGWRWSWADPSQALRSTSISILADTHLRVRR